MNRQRLFVLIVLATFVVCLVRVRDARMQSSTLRRITNTSEEGINLNPSISGDGRTVGFESTEDVAGAGGTDHFRAIRANITGDPPSFFQIAGSRFVAPAISQDGSHIAFASRDDLLGTNSDGNSEIFLFDGAKLIQVTNTSPAGLANRITNGNFQPSISDDGRFIAFSSNRDLAGQNSDANFEILVYDSSASSFSQLTNSSGIVGFTDAKISGDGFTVAYIRDNGATPGTTRDLLKQPRVGLGPITLIGANIQSLQMTYGRAISDDGARVVYAAETATNTTQVFMFDGRSGGTIRQITTLGARVTDVPLDPTISGDGSRIAFAARRTVSGAGSNSDGGVELYVYDFPTATFSKITNAPSSATAEVVPSLSDDGSIVAFNFPRVLSGAVTNSGTENNSEIYALAPPARPANGTLTAILNDASFGHEPSATKALAPNSIAAAQGTNLANTITQTQRLTDGTFPTSVGGVRVMVNGRAAQIFFVSPTQINFLVPPQTETGTAEVIVTNSENFPARGTVSILRAAPGIFTKTGDGIGEGLILNADTLQEGPFDPTGGDLRLTIFATGARNAAVTTVSIGGRIVNAEAVVSSNTMPGLDEVHVRVPGDLRGAGTVNLSVTSDGRDSNPVTINFLGDPSRAIFFNEVLSDPPNGIAGDANNDGVRDGTDDEFVEFVNGSASDTIGMSGWTVKTRATGSTTETTRFTFPAGTSLSPGTAAVVFGGGTFNPADPIFGCAQVFKVTSSAGLSLTNSGLTILLRDSAGNLIAQFAYGGSTGLDGNNSQSLTRSPDITGAFVLHTTANPARRFSPGLKVDGTPFGNCASHPATVTISPTATTVNQGQSTQFTAQAFDQFGRAMTGVSIAFTSDNTAAATIDSTSTNQSTGVVTANVGTHNPGVAHITASATDGTTSANSSPATLTVAGPALSVSDVSKNEGNGGPTTFTFAVSLSLPAPSGGVKFDIATQDGTATVANNDYVARALTNQVIPAGAQTYSFDVTVNGDTAIEPNENFFVSVSNVSGASITKGQGTGTILNDDSPTLSVSDVSSSEGNSGTKTFTFTVTTPVAAGPGPITFDIATADGTATSASGDYVARALTGQTIPVGQSSYNFDVTVNGDTLAESNETFFVNITNVSGAQVNDGQGQGTIQNDDTANLVISQVYPGGGLTNATYASDFIELFNRGTTTVDFSATPSSLQFLSTTASTWSKTDLTSGTILPGHYFLIKETSGGTGAALPAADATGTINLTSTTAGKVALVSNTTLLTGNCPGDDGTQPFNPTNVIDFVGYGGTAATANHCYEGNGPASFTLSNNTIADYRKAGGCTDTNDNAADFFTATPFPRNSLSTNNCAGGATPTLAINDVTITEGNSGTTAATFTVSLSGPAQGADVTFDIATANGTATTADNDYAAKSLTNQVIPAGQTSYTFTVNVNGDNNVENDEAFVVNVTNVVGASVSDGQGTGTIQNDDLPAISINDVSVTEGNSGTTNLDFTVSLSAPAPATVTFDIATADGTAMTSDNDYVASSLTAQTIATGQQTYHFFVTVNGDTSVESNETLFVNLTNVSGATVSDAQGQGTILNDDSPTLSITQSVSLTEGNSGTTNATFTVTLSPTSNQTVTVQYATADGTAKSSSDYQSTSGTLTFDPGDATKTIDVPINGDLLVEPDETFTITLSNQSPNAAISPTNGTGTGTIQNDDTAVVVVSQVYAGGGNTSAPAAVYKNDFIEVFNRGMTTVDLAGWSVQYSSASGTGNWSVTQLCATGPCLLSPGQYFLVQEAQGSGGTQNLPTPDAIGTIAMATASGKVALVSNATALNGACPSNGNILDKVGYGGSTGTTDFCYEGSGPTAAPSNVNAAFRNAGGCTDTNDNAADFFTFAASPRNSASPINSCSGAATPNLSINDVTVTEGNSGTTTATFTVSLSAPAQGTDVTFDIATQDNTATIANNDYVAKSLTNQIIPAGQSTYTFSVTVNGDTNVEPDESFFVNVTNVAGANVTDGQGTGTIQHDDFPALSVDDVAAAEGDSGTTIFTFHVTLSDPAPATVTFDVTTADGTAQDHNPVSEDNDYQARSLTSQTIAQGASSFDFAVTVNGDTTNEPNETFFVNVSNVSGATVADAQGLGTIQNDDAPPDLSITDVTQAEGNAGTSSFNFTVQLSAPAKAGGVSFTVNTADGTAASGSDYVAIVNGSGSIPEGSSSTTVAVTVNGDTVFEGNETFFLNLSNVTGANVTDSQGLGTISNDDNQPSLAIADASLIEGNSGTSLMTFTVTMTGSSQSSVTVNYATSDSSATVADADYDAASGMLTFAPGDTTKTFDVIIHGDTMPEGDEMFLVDLTSPSGATISDSQAFGTIFLDDAFSIAAVNTAYTENFDSLAQSGNSSTTPTAWTRAETLSSANTVYTANNGSSTTGDTYSYGTTGQTDRALGGLRTGSLAPTIGAYFKNDTGSTINSLTIAYTGEEWRLGTASRTDRLDFQYSTNATSLTTGTWTDDDALDFTTPNTTTTGAKDGNNATNRTALTHTITGLSIAAGATFWIRWTDFDASGADDGLAVDDFSITAGVNTPALTINDVSQSEGNSGTTTFNFTVQLSSPAPPGGVSFTVNTADGTTNPANAGSDYVAVVNGSGNIPQNGTSTTISVTVNGDVTVEPDETFFVNLSGVTGATVSDAQGLGTIQNDDSPPASADLSLTNTVNDTTPNIGQNVNFTIKISNAGPNSASSVQVTDLLPAGLQYVSSAVSQGTYVSGTGIWTVGTVATGTDVATLTITATVVTTGVKINKAEVTADATTDPDSTPNDGSGDDFATVAVTGAANVVINEIVTQAPSSPPANPNDFIELFNKSLTKTVDISGLVISYRTGASTTTATTFTLPGAVGSGTTTIGPNSYLIVVNGSNAYGVAADFNNAGNLDLTAASGGVKIELNGVKIDGLTYNNTSTAPAFFQTFGEGTAFQSPTTSGLQDYIRSPNGTDNDTNSTDFKRNGTTASITPKAANP